VLVPANTTALATALIGLLGNTAARARLGTVGHARYRERYTGERALQTHLDVFAAVIAVRSACPSGARMARDLANTQSR